MKRLFQTSSTLLFIINILFANPYTVLANEGDGGHQLEVDGYHVTLTSQNDWAKGENTIVVTLTDSMGMPVRNTDVKILIASKSNGQTESKSEMDTVHGTDQQQDTMPGMDMGNDQRQESMPGMDMGAPAIETSDMPTHDEENASPISMTESDEHGMYIVETHLESVGKHDVHVMFHVNGEILQADFVVEVAGTNSKNIVLWSFVMVNVALVASAGLMKKQSITVKGGQ
jgi:hypothetical protein